METTYQIGEAVGAPKHGFIPEDKRGTRERRRKGEAAEDFYQYIKEHDGQVITGSDFVEAGLVKRPENMSAYTKQLQKAGRITIVKEGALRRYYIGKRADAPGARANGPVVEKQPPAPVPRKPLENLTNSAWAHIRTRSQKVSPEQLGYEVIALDAFISGLESKLEYKGGLDNEANS